MVKYIAFHYNVGVDHNLVDSTVVVIYDFGSPTFIFVLKFINYVLKML